MGFASPLKDTSPYLSTTGGMDGTKETKILNPATEDPVARRAVTQLFHKACPDTTMTSEDFEKKIPNRNISTKPKIEENKSKKENSINENSSNQKNISKSQLETQNEYASLYRPTS